MQESIQESRVNFFRIRFNQCCMIAKDDRLVKIIRKIGGYSNVIASLTILSDRQIAFTDCELLYFIVFCRGFHKAIVHIFSNSPVVVYVNIITKAYLGFTFVTLFVDTADINGSDIN